MTEPTSAAFSELGDAFHALPLDEYLPDGGRYRFRRHAIFDVSSSGKIREMPERPYRQPAELNAFAGGIPRVFAPLGPALARNAYLRALLRVNMDQVTAVIPTAPERWQVDVHLVRIVSDGGRLGMPSPEGPHRDGFKFISIHLIGVTGVDSGGLTEVFDDRGTLVLRTRLFQPGDTIYLDDERFRHDASPIEAAGRGWRDVILCSYQPVK
ncbi:2OG-Fe dioxygenase family protein [Micromonospora sp. NPDC047753]|uniref:2OG-Fe dioxygenase family protein n=1 Tax=Micromonospora TaxID=1873 RepID=UPI0033E72D7E